MRTKHILLIVGLTLVSVLAGVAAVAAAVVYSGVYNVAATRQHVQPVFTLLATALRHSVRLRARDIAPPPLDDPATVLRGAACFQAKCVQCHGAPGVSQGDIGKSMQPLPGPLVDARGRWQPRELYWVTRHGIKMSGMPAWEYRMTEAELWSVVAFMQRLPDLNAQQYASFMNEASAAPVCGRDTQALEPGRVMPIDAERGRRALFQYACNACHTIPGVTSASPQVGPPLEGFANRSMIAGVLTNSPDNLVRWLRETQQVKPMTAMPQLGLTERDAWDIGAYLGTLR